MPVDSFLEVERTSWGTSNGLFIDLAKILQGFVGHNLVGVDEAKPGCGHILGFSDVGELFTLPNVDGDLTSLSAMFLILTSPSYLGRSLTLSFCRVAYRILGKPSVFGSSY